MSTRKQELKAVEYIGAYVGDSEDRDEIDKMLEELGT